MCIRDSAYHMEQIQIRQPKMPAAQSFIQIIGTFLATLFIFLAANILYTKNTPFQKKTSKPIGNTRLIPRKSNLIYHRKKYQSEMKLRI